MAHRLYTRQCLTLPSLDRQPTQALSSVTADAILDELGIELRDLAIYSDFIVPDGMDAFLGYYNGRAILAVYRWKTGYVCRRNNGTVYNDPQSAIVGGYETYNPGAVLLARSAVERDLEANTARAALVPEYA